MATKTNTENNNNMSGSSSDSNKNNNNNKKQAKGTQQKLSRDGHSKNRKSPTKTERIETFSDIFISDASSKRLTKVRA